MNNYKKECLIKDMLTIRYGTGIINYDDVDIMYIIKLNELIDCNSYGTLIEELATCYKWAIVDGQGEDYRELFRYVQHNIMDLLVEGGKEQ